MATMRCPGARLWALGESLSMVALRRPQRAKVRAAKTREMGSSQPVRCSGRNASVAPLKVAPVPAALSR